MEVVLAKSMGFCFGVRRAVDTVYEQIRQAEHIYTYGAIVKLLKRDSIRHGVNVTLENDKLLIELHIIVAYEVSILAMAENLVDNVKYKVEEYTGMEVGKIVVCVEGVKVIN